MIDLRQLEHEEDYAVESSHHVDHVLSDGWWDLLILSIVLHIAVLCSLTQLSGQWRLVDQILDKFKEILVVDLDFFIENGVVVEMNLLF